jgi:hypothetical protein
MTKLPCALTWSPESKLLQSLSVGSLEITNRSSDGDQSSASDFSNIPPEPAERRVLSSLLAYGGGDDDDLDGVGVPPWIANPYQLVSWWEMQKFGTEKLIAIVRYLTTVRNKLESYDRDQSIGDSKPASMLEFTKTNCVELGLSVSAKCVQHMSERMADNTTTYGEMMDLFGQLDRTIFWEMEDKLFMFVPPDRAEAFNKPELLGKDVSTGFPQLQFDIVEAGNCYAAGRSTAVVFHLMRIMETGVQGFGGKLGVTFTNEKNWQNILDEINKAIKALPPKDKTTVEMSQASANLYAVKLAWRNEVMHPKDTYTLEEADNLIRQVRLFMQQLAKII